MAQGARPAVIAFVLVALASAAPSLGETVVLPVVARGVHGINGSVWDSEVRISGPRLTAPGRITRLWVALPEGGFVDDPATAPGWSFPPVTWPSSLFSPTFMVVLTGDQLLQESDAPKGAVALDIEGTGNHVFLHNANTLGQPRLPQDAPCCLPGSGQSIRALTDPLVREGYFPWITSGRSPYRVSVGLINPTAQPRTITIALDRLRGEGAQPLTPPDGTYWFGTEQATLAFDIAPLGFLQVDDLASVLRAHCPSCEWLDWVAPTVVHVVEPGGQLPFYAYASVIWSPLNDPEFVPVVPVTP